MSDELTSMVEKVIRDQHEVFQQVAAALAPLIEARVREALRSARSEELDDVAAEFERSANRVEKAKGQTERTRYAHEVVEVLRNRAEEVRRG